jgi:hypothetical protein
MLTSINAYHYNGEAWWSLTATDLGSSSDVTLLANTDSEMWMYLRHQTDSTTYENRIVRISAAGQVTDTWPLTVSGTVAAFAADDSGFLLVTSETTSDDDSRSLAIRTVRVGRDGTESAETELFKNENFSLESSINARYYTSKKGVIVSLTIWSDGSSEDIFRTWYMNVDGSTRWYRPARWDEYSAFQPGLFHEFADGTIGYMNSENLQYIVLSADGSQMTTILTAGPDSPIEGSTTWKIIDWRVLDDGILVTGNVTLQNGHKAAVAAMYEPAFAALKWVRKYADDCEGPGLVEDTDGWMLWCRGSIESPECTPEPVSAGTYLHFDSICGEAS